MAGEQVGSVTDRRHPGIDAALATGAGALAVVAAVYGVYLLFLGPVLTYVEPDSPSHAVLVRQPTLAGVIPMAAAILLAYGLLRASRIAWAGAIALAAFAVLSMFGIGGVMLPVAAGALLVLALKGAVGALG